MLIAPVEGIRLRSNVIVFRVSDSSSFRIVPADDDCERGKTDEEQTICGTALA